MRLGLPNLRITWRELVVDGGRKNVFWDATILQGL